MWHWLSSHNPCCPSNHAIHGRIARTVDFFSAQHGVIADLHYSRMGQVYGDARHSESGYCLDRYLEND